jgi:hypothetical protein
MKLCLILLIIAPMLGGCVLLAAGVIGAEIERHSWERQRLCYYYPNDYRCHR